jgi:adenylate cyclase
VFRDSSDRLVVRKVDAPEPGEQPTLQTLQLPGNLGRAFWSDLRWSKLDAGQTPTSRRVELSVQEAVLSHGRSLGVARVGRWTDVLDRVGDDRANGKRIFLCDSEGRLVTRMEPGDPIKETGRDLRVVPTALPPGVEAALLMLHKHRSTPADSDFMERVRAGSEGYVASFRRLAGAPTGVSARPEDEPQSWMIGVVMPERSLLEPMLKARSELIATSLFLLIVAMIFLGLVLHAVHRALGQLLLTTSRMQQLDFSAEEPDLQLRELGEIATSLEGAKSSLRTLSKYAPTDLVRLWLDGQAEPDMRGELRGELRGITMMLTDVAGFTAMAEKLSIDRLAQRLGKYLSLMTDKVHQQGGANLERSGDALLVTWNAPVRIEDHPRRACLAALACRAASAELGWHTRFGIHTDDVMVGHFGTPERMNYGVLGDGVNLASRIEGLNKHYGTSILVSRTVAEAVPDGLEFRLVDRVSVKGRIQGIELYELMGVTGEVSDQALRVGEVYEGAFRLYLERRFADAQIVFESLPDDPPARTLASRCRAYAQHPPGTGWGGVFVASFK